MSLSDIRALTFDTGGTILDWHTGFSQALGNAGANHGINRDWPSLANEIRRKGLGKVVNLGKDAPPPHNFDGAHRMALEEVIAEHGLEAFTEEERHAIAYDAPHAFECWPDFPPVLPKLREKYICASFTILSFRIIMDTARRNGLAWDAVFSCEAIGKYKVLPEAYDTVAHYLQLDPSQICMVACHNFDLDAAKGRGYKTAFVRRPMEWGKDGPPDPEPNEIHDIVVDDFASLAQVLGVTA
ncbi:L-specific mono chloro propionoic acid dehalogenase [Sulfitobacter noctilucicola]|uniref:2-haloacid dehalogenase n=1 Tax=Sulfitobacter noctilucicola TaxID=1342301 RepID=A0A7W6MC29_9RHOB|nr:HAD family hydrolase [Sulfitobacter noctilucicola]KIN63985.1 L-specific mono chloro propionoic acid dehalogenase [Sulfitobacter noctilucicola]MBB4175341.1 2-haloacid dehalogenase [Sulfitobacter noctilucicola]